MAQSIRTEQFTPADEVRKLLTAGEKYIPDIKGSKERAVAFLTQLDRLAELWPQVEALGADLRPEAGRWETLQALTHKQAPALVREINAAGGFAALRSRHHPLGQAAWWWHLDQEVRQGRIMRARNAVLTLLGVALIAAAVVFVLNRLMPVDPKVQASLSKQMQGQRYLQEGGDIPGALKAFEEAIVLTPNDAEVWLWLGVAQKKLGDAAAAEASFARARQIAGNVIEFHIQRAQILSAAGFLDEARADIDAALALDPEEPRAYLYLGGILELQGQLGEAIQAMERASELSEKRDQPQLTAIARYRLAFMYQQLSTQPLVRTPTPTPR
jgi:tetratricopeptide (TPR) repeat protein